MSKYTIDSSTLTDIAEAIRTKTGGVSQMTPLEMPTEIGTIPTYENGDSESYPKVSIPSGTERTYSEQTISDIADAINTKAGTSGTMTPSAMITAIGNIPSGGGGGVIIPTFSKTTIATTDIANSPDTLTFTDDYTTYDFLEIEMQNTSSTESNKFITTPEVITECLTVGSAYAINEENSNQYGTYHDNNDDTWTRSANRNLLIKEIQGWNCTNCTITKTTLYQRGAVSGSNQTVTIPAGDSFYNYDYLMIATTTSDPDDLGDNPLMVPVRKDFGTDYKIGLGMNHYNALKGYTISNDTLLSGTYFYVQGIKFSNPKNSKSDTVLNYDDSMGYSSNIVAANNITNLLAYAFSQNKDLVVNVKVGTSTKSSDDVAFHFYWASEYLRCRFKHSTKQFKLQLGGGSSAWYTYVDTKAIKIRFNHSDNSIDIMQDGETTQHVAWPFSSDVRPLTNVPGSTVIYADSTWFEYLNMKIV